MQSRAVREFKEWVIGLDSHIQAIIIGLTIGILAGIVGLLIAVLEPVVAMAIILGMLLGLYILTDITPALYGSVAVMVLLPFGTFHVKIGITPTLLDLALGAFIVVYLVQWMTGQRRTIQFVWPHAALGLYIMWVLFSFMMGLRYGSPTSTIIRQFAETLIAMSLPFILVDLLQDPRTLRRLVLVIMALVGTQALLAIGLWILPDTLAESILVRLSRVGYPAGGVIRYIEANPDLSERAIGTWVDPNSLGGLLAVGAVMIAPQVFAKRPVLRYRWVTFGVLGLVVLALLLTFSRASFLAFSGSLGIIAIIRYRRFIPMIIISSLLLLFLPQTQGYIDRILQAFRGEDLATQMRIGEWTDSLSLIQSYPVFGVGFTGTPTNDVYTDVANMYLLMANQMGITGLLIFLGAMATVLLYARRAWHYAQHDLELDSIQLGYNIAVFTALINAVADLYFFRFDFQSNITWFWIIVALALASSRLAIVRGENQPLQKTSKSSSIA